MYYKYQMLHENKRNDYMMQSSYWSTVGWKTESDEESEDQSSPSPPKKKPRKKGQSEEKSAVKESAEKELAVTPWPEKKKTQTTDAASVPDPSGSNRRNFPN